MAALTWVLKVAYHVVKWLVFHPVATTMIGVVTYGIGKVLQNQTWAGAHALGEFFEGMGKGLGALGMTSFIARGVIARIGEAAIAAKDWIKECFSWVWRTSPLW